MPNATQSQTEPTQKKSNTRDDIIIGPCRACGTDGTLDKSRKLCIRFVRGAPSKGLPSMYGPLSAYRPERCETSEQRQKGWKVNAEPTSS